MAVTNISPYNIWSGSVAGEDLHEKQYTLVRINSEGKVVTAEEKKTAFVLLNTPKSGEAADLAVSGVIAKAKAGGTISPMDRLCGNSTQKLITATEEAQLVLGFALQAAVSGDVVSFVYNPAGARWHT